MPDLFRRELFSLALMLGIAVLGGAMVATTSLTVALAIIGVAALVLVLFVRPNSGILIGLAIALQMASATDYAREVTEFAVAVRTAAITLCLMVAINMERHTPRSGALSMVWLCGTLALLWVGAVSGVSIGWASAVLALAVTAIAIRVVAGHASSSAIGAGIDSALIVAYLASYAALALGISTPVDGGRLEGIFANANTLGFFAALGIIRFTITEARGPRAYLVLVLATPSVIWAASRAPAAALIIALTAAAMYSTLGRRGQDRRALGTVIVLLALAGAWLLQFAQIDTGLMRTNDSRADGVRYAMGVVESTSGMGHGYENGVVEIASTPLRWFADGGYVGLALVLVAYVSVLAYAWRLGWPAVLVATFGVTHSILEGWYFAGGSALFFSHWLAFIGATSIGGVHRPEADTATHADAQRDLRPWNQHHGRVSQL